MSTVQFAWVASDPTALPKSMPEPRLLVIVGDDPGGFMLVGFAADGSHAGDSFHEALEDAIDQAHHDVGSRLQDWETVDWDPEVAREQARELVTRDSATQED
jgi:hypothetical protein